MIITNLYKLGIPNKKNLIGREKKVDELRSLWQKEDKYSVLLYGQRSMGKTSLLRSLDDLIGEDIKVVYTDLQRLGSVSQGVAEVLMYLSYEISSFSGIPCPSDDDFLISPENTFDTYLKKVINTINCQTLIIVFDEYEVIQELIEAKQIESDFISWLADLAKLNSDKLAFVFSGFHLLEETNSHFDALNGKLILIKISYLNFDKTCQILECPGTNYTKEAQEFIYYLTSGQPYLVKLIGFLLVTKSNESNGKHFFEINNIEEIVDEEIFQSGRYFFEGILQNSVEQQIIAKALASNTQGLNLRSLLAITGLNEEVLKQAIANMIEHDVIHKEGDNFKIIVELFRRWLETKL